MVRVEKKKQRRRQRGNGDTESDGNALRSRSPSHSSPAAVLFLCEIPCSKLFLCVCGVWVLGGEKAYLQFIIIVRRSWGEVVPPPGKRCFVVVVVGCACFVCEGSPPSLSFVALLLGASGRCLWFLCCLVESPPGGGVVSSFRERERKSPRSSRCDSSSSSRSSSSVSAAAAAGGLLRLRGQRRRDRR